MFRFRCPLDLGVHGLFMVCSRFLSLLVDWLSLLSRLYLVMSLVLDNLTKPLRSLFSSQFGPFCGWWVYAFPPTFCCLGIPCGWCWLLALQRRIE